MYLPFCPDRLRAGRGRLRENYNDLAGLLEVGHILRSFIIAFEHVERGFFDCVAVARVVCVLHRNYRVYDNALETSDIADYKFSVESRDNGQSYTEVACESTFDIGDKSTGTTSVTFTNNTDSVLNNFVVVVALTDSEGNLVFVNSNYVGIIGVHPGSTITVDMSINSDFVEYYRAHGIEPASIEAHVYYKT